MLLVRLHCGGSTEEKNMTPVEDVYLLRRKTDLGRELEENE